MQAKPIFFDCDLGRFQLVLTTSEERIRLGKCSCDYCGFCFDDGCRAVEYGLDCGEYDNIFPKRMPYWAVHWRNVLPTSKSANTPRTECGTSERRNA